MRACFLVDVCTCAALIVVLAGCGDSAATGDVTVVYLDQGTNVVPARAIVHDASGRTLSTTPLGPDGRAQLHGVPTGGAVTVVPAWPVSSSESPIRRATTIFGVRPGDVITEDVRDVPYGLPLCYPANAVTLDIAVPPRSGAASYSVSSDCGPVCRGYPPGACPSPTGKLRAIGYAYDADNNVIAYASWDGDYATDVGDNGAHGTLGGWRTDFSTLAVDIRAAGGCASLSFRRGDELHSLPGPVQLADGCLPVGPSTYPVPQGSVDEVILDFQGDDSRGAKTSRLLDGSTVTFDPSALLPPMAVDMKLEEPSTRRPTLAFGVVPGTTPADALAGRLGGWSFVAPPTATRIRIPELPDDVATEPAVLMEVLFIERSRFSSYDDARTGISETRLYHDDLTKTLERGESLAWSYGAQ